MLLTCSLFGAVSSCHTRTPITKPVLVYLASTYELLQPLDWCTEELCGVDNMDTHSLHLGSLSTSLFYIVLGIVRTVLTVRRKLRGKLSQRFRTLTDSVGRSPISDDISELYTTKDGPSSNPRILPPSSTRLSDDMETISGQPRSPNNGLVTAREL